MWTRSLVVWLLIMGCETVLGTMRRLVLMPMLGEGAHDDLLARHIGFFIGTAMIVAITWFTVRWMCGVHSSGLSCEHVVTHNNSPPATTNAEQHGSARLILVGVLWALLTLTFEAGVGRVMAMIQTPDGGWCAVWSRLGEDYDLTRGGLMGIGLFVMALSPMITARLRVSR